MVSFSFLSAVHKLLIITRQQMRLIAAVGLMTLIFLAGCESIPTFPQPAPDEAQVLVSFEGIPKIGAKGPSKEDGEYQGEKVSVETGKRFQRVNYDSMKDVIVVLERVDGKAIASSKGRAVTISIEDIGFDAALYAVGANTGSVVFHNETDTKLNLVGFNESEEFFEVNLSADQTKTQVKAFFQQESRQGIWLLSVDQLSGASAKLIASTGLVWSGDSDEYAFFGSLQAGEYILRVHPPRLPIVTKTFTVSTGKRKTQKIKLTVNQLPKVNSK